MIKVAYEEYSHLCELPDDLIEEILPWLPAEYVCKLGTVCKEWDALFSSTRFITTQWADAPPNKKPILLVGAVEYNRIVSHTPPSHGVGRPPVYPFPKST